MNDNQHPKLGTCGGRRKGRRAVKEKKKGWNRRRVLQREEQIRFKEKLDVGDRESDTNKVRKDKEKNQKEYNSR